MRLTRRATLLAAVILAAPALAFLQDGKPAEYSPQPPQDLFEVVKVVDGDTVHVMRDGKVEKLRLLSVDTEEKLSGRGGSATKPETVYGEECALWAKEVIDAASPFALDDLCTAAKGLCDLLDAAPRQGGFDWRIATVHAQAMKLLLSLTPDAPGTAEARIAIMANLSEVLKRKLPMSPQSPA